MKKHRPRAAPAKARGKRRAAPTRAASNPAQAARIDVLHAKAWRLANRFGWLLDVTPADVFDATRGHARVETVRHLVAHVLLEIDRARPTDLELAMRRDRSSLRNSFRRAWDLRDDEDVERLIMFVNDTRAARGGEFRRAARAARAACAAALAPTGRGGRFRPEDFRVALVAGARALGKVGRSASEPAAPAAPALAPAPAALLPPAAALLDASPLTRRLLRDAKVAGEPIARTGGARITVTGGALKHDMGRVAESLARVLEAAGFNATREGVFEVPKRKLWRAVFRVAPALCAVLALLAAGAPSEKSMHFSNTREAT